MTASKTTTKKGSAKKDTKYPNPRGEYLWAIPGWSVSETTFPTAAGAVADFESNGDSDAGDVKICQVVETYGYATTLIKK